MANVLCREKRLGVLGALMNGNSVSSIVRMTEVNARTILRFGLELGQGAQWFHNAVVRDVQALDIEQDEIWSYVGKKEARCTEADTAAGLGEAYIFVALDRASRFALTWLVGKRDEESAMAFEADLRARLLVMPNITTDGFSAYPLAIGTHFGPGVDYAQTVKNYRSGASRGPDHRYEPPREPFMVKHVVFGAPKLGAATTAHIERHNGTMRHFIGRMRRLVYAFSKKLENHKAAIALTYCFYNFCWVLRTTRVTPAMSIGLTDHVWELGEFMDALLAAQPCELPEKQPLAFRKPGTAARELPGDRGFLRMVPSGGAAPAPSPETPPAAPAPSVAPVQASADATGQLDLFAWKPERLPAGQLDLFGIDFDPDHK